MVRPNRILVHARFITMDAEDSVASALAIANERILAVGSEAELLPLADAHTVIEDLDGAVVLPGLIDAHNHFLRTGEMLSQLRLYDTRSVEEILELVRAEARRRPAGAWIIGRGWDESLLKERRPPTREELDGVAPHHPVLLHRVWNKLVASSLAFLRAAVDRNTPQPAGDRYAGGWDMGADGEPTGLVRDNAKARFAAAVPPPTQEERIERIARASRAYVALGLTGVADPGLTTEEIAAYAAAHAQGRLALRAHLEVGAWGFYPPGPDLRERILALGVQAGFGDDFLRYDAVKIMADGGIGDRTAAMSVPYLDGSRASMIVPEDELTGHVRWCQDHGWPVEVHVCGDHALAVTVRVIAAARDAAREMALRHRVHHAYLPDEGTLERMARHSIPAVVQPSFIHGLGEGFLASLGPERARGMIPLRSYLEAGVPLAGSSDSTVADTNPFLGIWSAVTRRTAAGTPFDPAQALTRLEAIRLYTVGAAYAIREEHARGSLEPGKLADLVVLDRDILNCPIDDIPTIQSRKTIVGGRDVYVRSVSATFGRPAGPAGANPVDGWL